MNGVDKARSPAPDRGQILWGVPENVLSAVKDSLIKDDLEHYKEGNESVLGKCLKNNADWVAPANFSELGDWIFTAAGKAVPQSENKKIENMRDRIAAALQHDGVTIQLPPDGEVEVTTTTATKEFNCLPDCLLPGDVLALLEERWPNESFDYDQGVTSFSAHTLGISIYYQMVDDCWVLMLDAEDHEPPIFQNPARVAGLATT